MGRLRQHSALRAALVLWSHHDNARDTTVYAKWHLPPKAPNGNNLIVDFNLSINCDIPSPLARHRREFDFVFGWCEIRPLDCDSDSDHLWDLPNASSQLNWQFNSTHNSRFSSCLHVTLVTAVWATASSCVRNKRTFWSDFRGGAQGTVREQHSKSICMHTKRINNKIIESSSEYGRMLSKHFCPT